MKNQTKKEVLEEIYKLAKVVNAGIMDLERTDYTESSFAYDRVEQLRFDGYEFMNKKGYFRTSSKLTKAELIKERDILEKLSTMPTLTSKGIIRAGEKARKTLNEELAKDGRKALTRKQFAKLRHDFAEMKAIKFNEIVSSDTVIELSNMTRRNEAEAMYRDLQNEEKQIKLLSEFMEQKRKKGKDALSWSNFYKEKKKLIKNK